MKKRLFPGVRRLIALAGALAAAGANAQTVETSTPSLQTVEVLGVRLREKISQSTLTPEDLRNLPGTGGDPMRAVQSLPGVASADDGSAEPAVRGARPSDNAYYVDFLPVGYLYHMGGITSVFNGDLIRRFDMYSAAWSPEYGDVLGAVFDLSLRRPREDRIGGKLDVSLFGANVLLEGPINKDMSFFLSGRRSYFDLVAKTSQDKDTGVNFTMPVYSDTQGRLLWNLGDNNRLRVDFSTASDRLGFTLDNGTTLARQQPVLVGSSSMKQSFNSVAAVLDTDLGQRGANTVAVGHMVTHESSRLGTAGQISADVTHNYVREQFQWALGKDHELTAGGSLTSRQVNFDLSVLDPRCTEFDPNCDLSSAPQVTSAQSVKQNLVDAYLSDRWHITPQLTATGGVRLTRDDYLKRSAVEPRVGVEWTVASHTTLTAGVGKHSQSPSLDESLRVLGNPELARLESTQAAVGIGQTFDKDWSWHAEVYAKRFTGLVVSDPVLNFRNGASGTAKGLELLVKKEATNKLSGFLAVSLSRAERHNDTTGQSFHFDFDEPVIVTAAAQYKFSDRWQFGAKWSYHTGAPYTPIVDVGTYPDGRARPIYGDINSQRVPAYHRLDLRVDGRISPRWTWYAEVINAYGRKNVAGYTYSADYRSSKPVYQLPFLPAVGMQYNF